MRQCGLWVQRRASTTWNRRLTSPQLAARRAAREGVIIAVVLALVIAVLKPLVFDKVHPARVRTGVTPLQSSCSRFGSLKIKLDLFRAKSLTKISRVTVC